MYKVLFTTLIALLCYNASYTQGKKVPSIDSFVLKNGTVLHIGDTLTLGKVSGKSDRYQHLDLPPRGPFLLVPRFRLHKNSEGEDVVIQSFKKVYVSKSETKTVAAINSKDIPTYYLDINPAFEFGEISAVKKKVAQEEEEEEESDDE
jgi:hypothetical protein